MTWEQELKIQSKEIAEKIAPIMAKNMAEGMAKDMAEKIVQDKVDKSKAETAKNMFKLNLTVQQIADCTGLSCTQVEELQKEVMASVTQ